MKKLSIAILLSSFVFNGTSQPVNGGKYIRDTSFTIYSATASIAKTNPEAKVVKEFHSSSIAEEKNIGFCNAGNRKLLIDAFYPKQQTSKKRTAIIIIHGGGWRAGNRTLHYPLAQHLADIGYVCFTPEYRLSTEALYPAGVYDIK